MKITDKQIAHLMATAKDYADGDSMHVIKMCRRALAMGDIKLSRTQLILLCMIEEECNNHQTWIPRENPVHVELPKGERFEYRPYGAQDGNSIKSLKRLGLITMPGQLSAYQATITEAGRKKLESIRKARIFCAEVLAARGDS